MMSFRTTARTSGGVRIRAVDVGEGLLLVRGEDPDDVEDPGGVWGEDAPCDRILCTVTRSRQLSPEGCRAPGNTRTPSRRPWVTGGGLSRWGRHPWTGTRTHLGHKHRG